MKRTREVAPLPAPGEVGFVLTSDWHLRETAPVCRTDDFWNAQWKKVGFIADLAEHYNCPVIHAGDLFHHWKPSPYLLAKAYETLPKDFWTVYGNHDLPQHSLELEDRSGIYMLKTAGRIKLLDGAHCRQDLSLENSIKGPDGRRVGVIHLGVWKGKSPWPGCTNPTSQQMLEDNPDFDLIVSGDFHTPVVDELDGRLLVNPGSITRQTADQADFRPRVYLWLPQSNAAVPVYLPIEEGVVSRVHIAMTEERDSRLEAFISKLSEDWEVEMSFENNLRHFEQANNVHPSVMSIIQRAIE